MLKPDKNFKLPKPVKILNALATFRSNEARNDHKKLMIEAILFEAATRSRNKKEKIEG